MVIGRPGHLGILVQCPVEKLGSGKGLENVTILVHEMEELRVEGRIVILSIVPKSRVKVFSTKRERDKISL